MQNNINQSSMLQAYINQKTGQGANLAQNSNPFVSPSPSLKLNLNQNDTFEKNNQQVSPEDNKKKKIAKIALLSACVLSASAGIIAAFRHKGGITKSFKEFGGKIKKFFKDSSDATQETVQKVKQSAENMQDFQKGADNINNAKDSLIRQIFKKIPGYKKFDDWASNLYRKASLKTMSKKYAKAQNAIFAGDDMIIGAMKKSGIDDTEAIRLTELLAKRRKSLEGFTGAESIQGRITKIDDVMQNLDEEAMKVVRGLKEEGLFKGLRRLSKQSLAEEKLTAAKKLQQELIGGHKLAGLTDDESVELAELIKKVLKNDDGTIAKQINKGNKLFKNAYSKETTDLFEKLRDINYGCAPGDILGMGSTVGLLGLYTAQANSKEEKVGVTLTTGIPLLTTLGTTIFATTKMVSGAKALVLGGVTGMFASMLGDKINEKYKQAHNIKETPKTIVTLDDYADKVKEKISLDA